MLGAGETASNEGTVASEGAALEVVSMEALAPMPTTPRLPRPKPTPVHENPKPNKDKHKWLMTVHESPRKHSSTQAQKKDKPLVKDKEKVADLEAEEGMEDIDDEGMEPISKLLDYIPPHKGKVKVTKDLDAEKFLIHMPLLPESITFDGSHLAWIPHLKNGRLGFG